MPPHVVQQPNGKFARWSSTVDDLGDLNMSEQDVYDQLTRGWFFMGQPVPHDKALQLIAKAKAEAPGDWNECMELIQSVSVQRANEIQKQIDGTHTPVLEIITSEDREILRLLKDCPPFAVAPLSDRTFRISPMYTSDLLDPERMTIMESSLNRIGEILKQRR